MTCKSNIKLKYEDFVLDFNSDDHNWEGVNATKFVNETAHQLEDFIDRYTLILSANHNLSSICTLKPINILCIKSKYIEVYEGFRTLVWQSLLIAIKF